MRAVRLPKYVHYPFGYRIRVVLTDEAGIREAAECDGDDDTPDGVWDVETKTIFVLQALPIRRQRYVLGHEMRHALADWEHEMLNLGAAQP